MHVPDERRKKLDLMAIEAIFVDYDGTSKAYRCYVSLIGKIIISRDVKFVYKNSDWKIHQDQLKQEIEVTIAHLPENDFYGIDKENRRKSNYGRDIVK